MYGAGRPATMMEVNCWLPIMPERDPPATFTDLIALPVLTTSRVQLQVQNMPCMVYAGHAMTKKMPTARSTYKHISTDEITMQVVLPMRNTSATPDSHNVHPQMMLQKCIYHQNPHVSFFPTQLCYGQRVLLSHSVRGLQARSN